MKKKSKITGEIDEIDIINITGDRIVGIATHEDGVQCEFDCTLDSFNDKWEDVPEEPKEYWCIDWTGGLNHVTLLDDSTDKYEKAKKQIGNYFKTREEAEKAVEKLKAWKRLKDKGFRFKGLDMFGNIGFEADDKYKSVHLNVYPFRKFEKDEGEFLDDLYSLFGGKE